KASRADKLAARWPIFPGVRDQESPVRFCCGLNATGVRPSWQQVLDGFAFLLQLLQRRLEFLLPEGVEFEARDDVEIAFAVAAAGVAEDQAGGHGVFAF